MFIYVATFLILTSVQNQSEGLLTSLGDGSCSQLYQTMSSMALRPSLQTSPSLEFGPYPNSTHPPKPGKVSASHLHSLQYNMTPIYLLMSI